jgi:hypothetical protein
MIETKLKLVDSFSSNKTQIKLHPEILTILLENRRSIKNVFFDINGLYDISHMGISIIDPAHELIAFSSTPNIEYNLIHQNLWKHDHCFSPCLNNLNRISWWDIYEKISDCDREEIEIIKLRNNKFSLGITISRQVNDFCFLYSYATRSKRNDLQEYYESNTFGLIDIGDYFYKSILDIYSSYSIKYKPPELGHLISKVSNVGSQPYLRLVVSNPKIE